MTNKGIEIFSIFFNGREAIADVIGDIVVFLQFKEFELYWAAVFFKDVFTHFSLTSIFNGLNR